MNDLEYARASYYRCVREWWAIERGSLPKQGQWRRSIAHCVLFAVYAAEGFNVAKGKSSGRTQFGDFKFASITLTDADKAKFTEWYEKSERDVFVLLAELLVEDWKASVTWDGDNDCFIASLTCRAANNVNENVVVTSRSDDSIEAVMLSIYKIRVLYSNKALPTERAKNNWG